MTPVHQQIEKLRREIEQLLADSTTRMEKEHALFLQKLAKIDAKIAALTDPPPPKKKRHRQPPDGGQLSLLE